MQASLSGVKVAEGPGRLAVPVCTSLLAMLGAEVVRVAGTDAATPDASGAHPLMLGKQLLSCRAGDELQSAWQEMARTADVVVAGPAALPKAAADGLIRCGISATGADRHPDLPDDAPEIAIQAAGGLMATSGYADGPPQPVRLSILDVFTGIDAATSVLAALRVVENGGPAQSIDAAVWDTNASLLGTFVAQVSSGKASGYRDGSRHSICAPWNAYAARDGHVMICTSSDEQWHRLLELMGKTEVASDPRFLNMSARRRHVDAVDALVAAWTSSTALGDLIALLRAKSIPVGVVRFAQEGRHDAPLFPFKLSRTPLRAQRAPGPTWPRRAPRQGSAHAKRPLHGIRVVEIGPFTAGPLAGRSLGDLGADVLKVEPPKGEVSRSWSPRAGHVSGYFANYNAGKRSAVLDLNGEDGRQTFERLLSSADVLVANLKAGALDKLGFGAGAVLHRHPRLVYCSISGYGQAGPRDAALDTVIQAESGIMSCVGLATRPCKVGFSVADLIAGHLAPLAILAALRARDRDGLGQLVDLSMLDALRWLMRTGSASPDDSEAFEVERHADGWVLSGKGGSRLGQPKVRDLGEVFSDPSLARRRMLLELATSGGPYARIIGSPYALELTPPRPGAMIGEADLESVLADWSSPPSARGALA